MDSLNKLEAAEIEKQKYIMGVVHEIKTPIAALQSYLDIILGKFLGPLDEKVEEKLERSRTRSGPTPVSYTHLDVYKRQIIYFCFSISAASSLLSESINCCSIL